jgi:PAS domain S-box-containing protein
MTRAKEQLIIENEELQLHLTEAEEALAAIRSGEVDAIIVPGSKGQQVYTLSSADTPYRTFIEEMDEGAATLSKEGLVIYCNRRFAEMVNEPIERVIGSYFKSFVIPRDRPRFEKLLTRKEHNNKNALTLSLVNSLYLKLSFHLLPSYLQGNNCILVATDVTEMKREQEKLLELASLLDQKFEVIKQLRMRLIEKKIDADVEIKKLKNTNKKLVQKIARYKQVESDLKLKLRQKKKTL